MYLLICSIINTMYPINYNAAPFIIIIFTFNGILNYGFEKKKSLKTIPPCSCYVTRFPPLKHNLCVWHQDVLSGWGN